MLLQQRREEREQIARITAPQHIQLHDFTKHRSLKGFKEDNSRREFLSSDLLLSMDNAYGKIQMGYQPNKRQTFIISNIKTSIYDYAPSKHQKEIKEYQMMRGLKDKTQNILYTSKRSQNSVAIIFKKENKPWSKDSIAPYIKRANAESLKKTMPFINAGEEYLEKKILAEKRRALQGRLESFLHEKQYGRMQKVREEQLEVLRRGNFLNNLLSMKDSASRSFFRKINYAYDIQKREISQHYKYHRLGKISKEVAMELPDNTVGDKDNE